MNIDIEKIISKYPESKTESLRTLLYHERNKKVFYSSGAYYMRDPKGKLRVLSGLLPALKRCFWSKNDYFSVIGDITKIAKKNGQSVSSSSGGFGKFTGNLRGSVVHEQLNDFLLLDKKNFFKKHSDLHPFSRDIINLILDKKWIPIVSEFDIFDSKLVIGTSIDMIAFDPKNGKIIAIEIKTGYKNHFEIEKGKMTGCLKKILGFSFHNCAMLQLLTSMLFIIKNHNIDSDMIEGYIIHVNDSELNSYKISQKFLVDYGKNIYDNLYKKYISDIKLKRKLKKDAKESKNRNYKRTPKKIIKKKKPIRR
jgi:hypothetical protein